MGHGPDRPIARDDSTISIEAIIVSEAGTALIIGWTDDRESPVGSLLIMAGRDRAWLTTAFGRLRRSDVESVLQAPPGHLFGFWAVVQLEPKLSVKQPWSVRTRHADGRIRQADCQPRTVRDAELRDTILTHFASAEFYGNRDIESFLALDAGIGAELIALNRRITSAITSGAWVSRYGPERSRYDGSIVVCLFGKSEFLFLQSALFSLAARRERLEFVFVSNSPELTEVLQKESQLAARLYGVSIVLVCLPGNAGFGAANNIAARFARSGRILITNPDVFPRDNDWARRHTDLIEAGPSGQTLIFGAPLFYDDGSLMHHGMYFEVDEGTSVRPDGIFSRPMIRVEHYGKGAPSWTNRYECPRPVPAVTGAFISVDRDWFESLGGFNEDFLFGHYEDADLSLRSLVRDRPVWIQDFPLWHLEGKGSTRRVQHEGGSLVNRWLFGQCVVGRFDQLRPAGADADYAAVLRSPTAAAPAAVDVGVAPPIVAKSARRASCVHWREEAVSRHGSVSSACRSTASSSAPTDELRVLLVSLFHPEIVRGGAQPDLLPNCSRN